MKNWKTTLLGVLMILGAIINVAITWLKTGVMPDLTALWPAILGGWGLLTAADAKQTPPPDPKKTVPLLALALVGLSLLSGCGAIQKFQESYERTYSVTYQDKDRAVGASVDLKPLKGYAK